MDTGPRLPVVAVRHIAMATDFEILAYGAEPDTDPESIRAIGQDAFTAIDRLEAEITNWKPDSATSLLNREAANHPVTVSPDMISLLKESKRYHESTGGAFDITVGPLLDLWGFYGETRKKPEESALKQVLESIGLTHVKIDENARTVFFEKEKMRIDFGGIGKGLALDRAAALLKQQGIENARLYAGSSTITALGAPPGTAGWIVDIRSPYNNAEDAPIATVTIHDESMSTSSCSERYVDIDGVRYGHILDPRTGWPVSGGVLSATVIAPTGIESDALSTAFFVMGEEGVRAYCKDHKQVRCILMVESGAKPEILHINFSDDVKKEPE